ncbi:MAG TPA: beta-galactosidase [Arachnia sp.]|mgnify:CR=1 FL=1|nr:beta-galactosidase [Arachnia sp.]
MLFGSAYYHEYQPSERLAADLDLMAEAGFTVIRVGESTWASHEPRDGEIDFGELARVVDAAGERGIKVIVGTPTYAIPAWLARKHPEVMGVNPDGTPVAYGARQNMDYASPVFRPYAPSGSCAPWASGSAPTTPCSGSRSTTRSASRTSRTRT